jgi:hypothetical protein
VSLSHVATLIFAWKNKSSQELVTGPFSNPFFLLGRHRRGRKTTAEPITKAKWPSGRPPGSLGGSVGSLISFLIWKVNSWPEKIGQKSNFTMTALQFGHKCMCSFPNWWLTIDLQSKVCGFLLSPDMCRQTQDLKHVTLNSEDVRPGEQSPFLEVSWEKCYTTPHGRMLFVFGSQTGPLWSLRGCEIPSTQAQSVIRSQTSSTRYSNLNLRGAGRTG